MLFRLAKRKGRIQRIGQSRNEVWIAKLRYRGSEADRVDQAPEAEPRDHGAGRARAEAKG
jgi:hypothetical protein